jgi:hypothetical protein
VASPETFGYTLVHYAELDLNVTFQDQLTDSKMTQIKRMQFREPVLCECQSSLETVTKIIWSNKANFKLPD